QRAPAWVEMRERVLSAATHDPDARRAVELLKEWDGCVTADSPTAAVYELFLAEMIVRVAKAKAPRSWQWVVGGGLSPITPYNFGCYRRTGHLVRLLRELPPGWFPHPWPEEIARALAAAVRTLRERTGSGEVAKWAWGAL